MTEPREKSSTSGQLNWTRLDVSSCLPLPGIVCGSSCESESERAGRTLAAIFLATRLAYTPSNQ